MSKIVEEDIIDFLDTQRELVRTLSKQYPDCKDLDCLTDFPKAGIVGTSRGQWKFNRHGAGIRFVRFDSPPTIIVDIHKHINNPFVIDEWRLVQFFESLGHKKPEVEISVLISSLLHKNKISVLEGDGYVFTNWRHKIAP